MGIKDTFTPKKHYTTISNKYEKHMFEGDGVSDLSGALVEIARNKMKICFIWMFVLKFFM